jgi:crotonobetainyl-CoA:carnitine CoA-transferase CaiB-like acyl-CoA transferase
MSVAPFTPAMLDGVRVLDLSRVIAGPFAAQSLAEMGADVVKVEFPSGDPSRQIGPHQGDRSLYFSAVNTGKRGVMVDGRTAAGRATLRQLIASADVVIENFRPASAAALGITPDDLLERYPTLVVVTICGYSRRTARGEEAAYDVSVQAEAGVMSVTGVPDGEPVRAGVPISDLAAGLYAALGAVGGLVARHVSGRGRHIEVPLMDATLPLLCYMATAADHTGEEPGKVGSGHHSIVPYGAYPTADGWVVIAVLSDGFWEPLCRALGLDDLLARPGLARNSGRLAARAEVDAAIAAATSTLSAATVTAALERADVPHAPVNDLLEVFDSPYVQERGMVARIPTPEGVHAVVRGPLHDGTPPRPAPALGEHTDEVIAEWSAPRSDARSRMVRRRDL